MIGIRKSLSGLGVTLCDFSEWVDQGIRVAGKDPSNIDLPLGGLITEIELVISNFAKGPVVKLEHLPKSVLHATVIAITSMQVIKGIINGNIQENVKPEN